MGFHFWRVRRRPSSSQNRLRRQGFQTGRSLRVEGLENRLLMAADVPGPRVFVHFETSEGIIPVELYGQATPQTVQNFLNYVNADRYEDTIIHRSVEDFVIQGGGFDTSYQPIVTAQDPTVQNEPGILNTRGTIAMAKLGNNPNSATSQWFINLKDNPHLDTSNGGFTVFGRVVGDGMTVVDAVAAIPTYQYSDPFGEIPLKNFNNFPNAPSANNLVTIDDITVLPPLLHNPDNSLDVDGNGVINSADADAALAKLNASDTRVVAYFTGVPQAYADVNGDNLISPRDIVRVINTVSLQNSLLTVDVAGGGDEDASGPAEELSSSTAFAWAFEPAALDDESPLAVPQGQSAPVGQQKSTETATVVDELFARWDDSAFDDDRTLVDMDASHETSELVLSLALAGI